MTHPELVGDLNAAGYVSGRVRAAFENTPRGSFVPSRAWVWELGKYRAIEYVDSDTKDENFAWFSAVYTDRTVVTQFDDGKTCWPSVGQRPTSSATAPSVVATMLSALDVHPGQSVLEVGTGTGYTTALLGELVGPEGLVSTIEIDPTQAEPLRSTLCRCVHHNIRTHIGDGTTGDPARAPFDRVIATVSVKLGQVPYAWVEQTRPGGVLVVPVHTDLASGALACFTVHGDGTATGRTLSMTAGFTELRSQRTVAMKQAPCWNVPTDDVRPAESNPADMLDDIAARWALAIALPSCRYELDETTSCWWLRDPASGSCAVLVPEDNGHQVRQAGPRRLWDEARAAYAWWNVNGRPPWPAWKWTITPEGQGVYLGKPEPVS